MMAVETLLKSNHFHYKVTVILKSQVAESLGNLALL